MRPLALVVMVAMAMLPFSVVAQDAISAEVEDAVEADLTLEESTPANEDATSEAEAAAEEQVASEEWGSLAAGAQEDSSESGPEQELPSSALMRGVSWDVDVEGGVAFAPRRSVPHDFFARLRAGVLLVREPLFIGFGPVAEVGGLSEWGFGGQVDLVHIWAGYALHLGGVYAKGDDFVLHAAIGYTLFSIEYQHHFGEDPAASDALFFKIGIPIGILAYSL